MRQTLQLQGQQGQKRPCEEYKMGGAARALKHTKLTAAEVGPAVAPYLTLLATDAYIVGLRARGNVAGGAGTRSLAVLSSAGQKHLEDVCETDAPYVAESRAVVAAREEVERVSGGKVLEALLVYLLDDECCDEEERERILGAFQLLARCAFAFLNRLERQVRELMSRGDLYRLLAIMKREVVVSRREIMPKAFEKGGPKKPLLVVCLATAVAAPGQASRPLVLAWIAETDRDEICSQASRRFLDSPFHQALLAGLSLHLAFALPTDKGELDIARMQYGHSKLTPATGKYWGFEGDDDDGTFAVYYSMPMALIANLPERIATQLLSDAHTKGPNGLLDLNSPATVKLIGDAYNQGSPCGAVEVVHFLQKRDSYTTVDVNV
jgi:hypothetical protein